MSIRLRNKKIHIINLCAAFFGVIALTVPTRFVIAETTTKAELTQRITGELSSSSFGGSSSGAVLGEDTGVPFFPRGFVYPIAELGNCDNQASCFTFCEQQQNLELCAMLSYRQGTMNASQLKKTLTFAHYMHAGYFASCDSMHACADLCDKKETRDECNTLALSLDKGIQVLGATDVNPMYATTSVLDYCGGAGTNCYENNYGTGNVLSIMDILIASGKAPEYCNTAEQCQTYCATANTPECTALYSAIADMGGMSPGMPYGGRVLNASTDAVATDSLTLGNDAANQDNSSTYPSIAYQPQGVVGCVISSQTAPTPYVQTDAEQSDNFMQNVKNCDRSYGGTTTQAQSYASTGKSKALSGVSDIYNCIVTLESSLDIQRCLSR